MIEFINTYIFPSQDIAITLAVAAIFIFAGIIKGFLGIGLPASAMAFLTLVMDPTISISLLTLPIIITNLIQYAGSKRRVYIAQKYWIFAFAIVLSIFLTSSFILTYPTALLTTSIGLAMVAFSVTQMFAKNLSIGGGYGWHIVVGLFSGTLGGLSSIWSPPVAMYLLARNVDKNEFICATGFLFLAGSLPLAAGLTLAGVLTVHTVLQSMIGVIFVLFGFRLGEALRNFVPQGTFRKIILWAFLIMGTRLIAISLT